MDTEILVVNVDEIDKYDKELDRASDVIKRGGLVAFPTETVYGLGGDGLLSDASKRIYEAKGRPSDNPLILHIADRDDVYKLAADVSDNAVKLMDAFWPGPMTLVFKKTAIVPYETTGGLDTVAIRFPIHPIAMELIRRSGKYIAAPSANLSGKPSPTKAKHVIDDMMGRVDAIIDGGAVDIGLESTIIDVTGDVPIILRPGFITDDMIKQVLGRVEYDKAVLLDEPDYTVKPKAPGMKYKHYAPEASLTLVRGENGAVSSAFAKLIDEAKGKGLRVGLIVTEANRDITGADHICVIGDRNNLGTVAHNLFGSLREMDEQGVDVIFSESFSEEKLGRAIMNRLLKAAGYSIYDA